VWIEGQPPASAPQPYVLTADWSRVAR